MQCCWGLQDLSQSPRDPEKLIVHKGRFISCLSKKWCVNCYLWSNVRAQLCESCTSQFLLGIISRMPIWWPLMDAPICWCFAPGPWLKDEDLAGGWEHGLIPSLMEEDLLGSYVCQGCFSSQKEDLRRPYVYVLVWHQLKFPLNFKWKTLYFLKFQNVS